MNARNLLETSRRQVVKQLSIWLASTSGLSGLAFAILLIFTPNLALAITVAIALLCAVGYGITLMLIERVTFWKTILPIVIALLLTAIVVVIFLPELALLGTAVLLLLLLLASLTNNRQMIFSLAAISALIWLVVFTLPPLPGLAVSLGAALPITKALGGVALVVAGCIVCDRLIVSQNLALDLADQRAGEAEAARAEAEAARVELAHVQRGEQERLLSLVQTLELPIIPIGAGVLVAPLVGSLDSRRITDIQQRLLATVSEQRAHTVVLDVTGISVIDTAVARQLLQTAQGLRLLGAQTMISGIGAEVAQTLVGLGIDLEGIQTVRDLGQALEELQQAHTH